MTTLANNPINEHFPLEDVLDLYSKLDRIGIKIWLDGGWGVDALLCKQTRLHSDLDIIIQQILEIIG
jgi:lincosamide nucleotidyltransferase A/C/D/E